MAAQLNIVLVEDHDSLREITVDVLRQHGHQVTGLACAEEVDETAGSRPADLYIIDLNLPGEDGIHLAQRIRKVNTHVGIIMVTARSQLQDKLNGYASGADIYLPKPVAAVELLAAIQALERRLKTETAVPDNSLMLDLHRLLLTGPTAEAELTNSEATLLGALAQAPGHRLDNWQLAEILNQDMESFSKSSLEVRIVRLRKKIIQVGGSKGAIKSIRLQGYQLCLPLRIS